MIAKWGSGYEFVLNLEAIASPIIDFCFKLAFCNLAEKRVSGANFIWSHSAGRFTLGMYEKNCSVSNIAFVFKIYVEEIAWAIRESLKNWTSWKLIQNEYFNL